MLGKNLEKSLATMCKLESSSPPLNLPYLPDDILLNCLARVSRLYYPTLSLVSKRFRSLLASLELYKTRTLLGRTESCLYLCLRLSPDYKLRWFTLCRRPCSRRFSMKKEKKSSDNFMVSIPPRIYDYQYEDLWGKLIAVGSYVYMIGGGCDPSSRVLYMDCRSHTWYEAPSMQIAREFSHATVLDGIIYVMDDEESDFPTLIEFFDPKTEKWECVPNPSPEIKVEYMIESLTINGNLYIIGSNDDVVYKPKENRWDAVEEFWGKDLSFTPHSSCVIDNVLYNYDYESSGKLKWLDFEAKSWRVLKGLRKQMPTLPTGDNCVRLVNYGGKIAVLWEKNGYREKKIWCAEIALERRNKKDIVGKVEWCSIVLNLPKNCHLEEFIVVTV